MLLLIIVSILWAFSFAIIGSSLSTLDSTFVATTRLALAWLCFLPFFRTQSLKTRELLSLVFIGALQFGVMYTCYIRAFAYLPSHLVALFSVLTPLYIAFTYEVIFKHWQWHLIACAILSIAGAVSIKFSQPSGSFWIGFSLMQIANIAFGLGQVFYREWRRKRPQISDHGIMAALYAGGATFAGLGFLLWGDSSRIVPNSRQVFALLYLGIVASGVGFFLWNKGATKATPAALAASNNAVVPLAMFVSLFLFGEANDIDTASVIKLIIGATLIFGAMALGQLFATKPTARRN